VPRHVHATDAELIERIKSKVHVSETGCWVYPGSLNGGGYCQASFNGKKYMVHRFMYELTYGMKINPKLVVCHECDNPRCCNPEHLWIGTEKQNMRDAADKRRWSRQRKTHCKRGHEYTPETSVIRIQRGRPARNCLLCNKLLHQTPEYKERARERQREQRRQQQQSATT
jgi:hypothetical protein